MKTSETIGKISESLAKAQGEMKPASFDAMNPHFRSRYATLASIMEACRSALSQNNIAIIQGTSVEEDRVVVNTMLTHSSGEWISDSLSMNINKDSPQAIGSAITYARRYSLSSMVGIVSDEDDDAEGAMPKNAQKTEVAQKPVRPAIVTDMNEHKKTRGTEPAKAEKTAQSALPAKTEQPVNTENPAQVIKPAATKAELVQDRVGKIRQIFTLSAKLGHTPEDMKVVIGNHIGLGRPIKESAEIKDTDIDSIINLFSSQLNLKEAA